MIVNERTVPVGPFQWFTTEVAPAQTARPPVLLLHGLPAQCYVWRRVIVALGEAGHRAIAPDWLGFGNSSKPEVSEFSYRPDAYLAALDELIAALGLERFAVVAQGFLGSVGIQYALRHPGRIAGLVAVNAPLTAAAKLPWTLRQLGLPLVGDMLVQNPLSVDQALEGGGYPLDLGDLAVYRRPYSAGGDAGRALMQAVRRLDLTATTAEFASGFAPWRSGAGAPFPVAVLWGENDRYLPRSIATEFAAAHPQVRLVTLPGAGHFPQEQAPEELARRLLDLLV